MTIFEKERNLLGEDNYGIYRKAAQDHCPGCWWSFRVSLCFLLRSWWPSEHRMLSWKDRLWLQPCRPTWSPEIWQLLGVFFTFLKEITSLNMTETSICYLSVGRWTWCMSSEGLDVKPDQVPRTQANGRVTDGFYQEQMHTWPFPNVNVWQTWTVCASCLFSSVFHDIMNKHFRKLAEKCAYHIFIFNCFLKNSGCFQGKISYQLSEKQK